MKGSGLLSSICFIQPIICFSKPVLFAKGKDNSEIYSSSRELFIKENKMRKIPVSALSSSLLIFLFTYTSVSKLITYNRFRDVLSQSPMLENGADVIAWLLPATELLIVLLLFFTGTRKTGLYASLFLLLLLTIYLVSMILYSLHLPCNCGGVISKLSWKEHIVFNAVIIVINLAGIYSYKKK